MIILFGHTKGGVGKSTLAFQVAAHLAREGRVLLVDADEQSSSTGLAVIRAEAEIKPAITAIELKDKAVRQQVPELAKNYEFVVIDAGGRNTASLRAALSVADLLIVPVPPQDLDIWALDNLAEILAEARGFREIEALTVLNRGFPQGTDNGDAAEILAERDDMTWSDVTVINRKAWSKAQRAGETVVEHGKDSQASNELRLVIDLITERNL
ncbi:MAG: AAA family ATPase [Rhodospirillales bacterium]|nr:AAA family ATPase [Rhodospirillales bacterium]